MSIRVASLVWDRFPFGGSQLLVMLAFADWGDDDGRNIYPSIAKIASKIRLSSPQARRLVHELIDMGWISVVGNDFGGAPGSTRRYQLNLEKLLSTPSTDASPTPSADARGSTDARPRTGARDGLHPCAETASAHASQTVIEPLITITSSSSADEGDQGVRQNGPHYRTKKGRNLTGWKLETFNRFWGMFAYKTGKAEAADAWLDIPGLSPELVDTEILPAATREAQNRPRLIEQKRTPKMAQGWLSGRRWEDEVSTSPSQVDQTDGYNVTQRRQEVA